MSLEEQAYAEVRERVMGNIRGGIALRDRILAAESEAGQRVRAVVRSRGVPDRQQERAAYALLLSQIDGLQWEPQEPQDRPYEIALDEDERRGH